MKKIRIVFVDDEKGLIETNIKLIDELLQDVDGFCFEYDVINNQKEFSKISSINADVVLFDCDMSGGAFDGLKKYEDNEFGYELIKKFRKTNNQIKVIFYSGYFSLEGSRCYDFSHEEMLKLINDLHIYKMIPKNASLLAGAIKEAIFDLDPYVHSLREFCNNYGDRSIAFDGEEHRISEIIKELNNNTELGKQYRNNVNKLIIAYMSKFGGNK